MSNSLQADCEALKATLSANPVGLTPSELIDLGWDKDRLRNAAGALKQSRRMEIVQHAVKGLVFVDVPEDFAQRFADLTEEHRTVYKLISDASTQGIWAKDLATRSKIPAGSLARVTRMLEHRKLIKQITPAQFKSRKVWMLYELEPATELSGGSWYKNGEIGAPLQLRSSTME
jgi:DNA-directed RNA polymerase III subunit RPC6